MKLVNYVAVGLLGVFAGVSGTIAYMEYITTPAKYCPIDLNREGMTEKIFIQDRRGRITPIDANQFMDINNIPKNKGIQKDYEKKDYKKQDYSPPKPQRNILKGIERGIA